MCFGLPAWTAISKRLCAKTRGVVALKPPLTTFSMFAWSAEAKTSAGAPCWIWVTRVGLPAKLNLTFSPGSCVCSWLPILVKASVREAAASTVRVPEGFAEGAGVARDVAPPQATTSSPAAVPAQRAISRRSSTLPSLRLTLLFLDDHVVGLEHRRCHIPDLEAHPVGRGGGDDGRHRLAADVDADLG